MYSPLVSITSPVASVHAYFWSPDYNVAFLFQAARINLLFSSYWQSHLRTAASSKNMEIWEVSFDTDYWYP
jgi:hypothetical protein